MEKKLITKIIGGSVILAIVGAVIIVFAVRMVIKSGITSGPDNLFGDQHLKTAVALIELHKVRYGKYPDKLTDLRFTGEWDAIALNSVTYYVNSDHTAYFVEVDRGWVGKPKFQMPPEFWKGTGYDPSLKQKR